MRGRHADSKIHIFNVKLPHYMKNGKCFIKVMKLQYCGKTMVKTDNNNLSFKTMYKYICGDLS